MASIGRHSLIHWRTTPEGPGDTPETVLEAVCIRLREMNRSDATKARELSLAITHCEEAGHWLRALAERRGGSA